MNTLLHILYWLAIASPILVNAYICLASYLWQRRCNEEIYKELAAIRLDRRNFNERRNNE